MKEKYNLTISLRHIKLGKSDISADFYAAGIILRTKEGKLKSVKGKARTQASLLNFKPPEGILGGLRDIRFRVSH